MAAIETLPPPAKARVVTSGDTRDWTATRSSIPESGWNAYEKIAFRFFFVYFALQILPLDWKYYRDLAAFNWIDLPFNAVFYLARYVPRFSGEAYQFSDWGIIAAIATVSTIVWSLADQKRSSYNDLYYSLRTLIRYRLALALLAYGFIKLFPMQMPLPSLSSLNTSYGDITHWKIFSLSTGIVPGYQSFLGLVEIFAALLLLNRKTTIIAAFIIIPFLGNVFVSNLAYEGGEYVYSLLLLSFALFLFAYDGLRLLRLTSFERTTLPNRYKPSFITPLQRYGRIALKSLFIIFFVVVYGAKTYSAYAAGGYQYPTTKGLAGAAGLYNVSEFTINGSTIPYSTTDQSRWKDVVFETWATLSVRSDESKNLVTANTEEIFQSNDQRIYEYAGLAGRVYYHYTTDTLQHQLTLIKVGDRTATPSVLTYSRPVDDRIILSGILDNDSVSITLDKRDKKYLLQEAARAGRRKGLKL